MRPGDKVVLKSNAPLKIWDVYTEWLIGNVYTIRSIEKLRTLENLTSEREVYIFEEFGGLIFPADEFIPYKGLTVLINRRKRKYEI